jgi:hypothetical protein
LPEKNSAGCYTSVSSQPRSKVVSKEHSPDKPAPEAPQDRGLDAEPPPVTNRTLAIFLAALAAALVLGYLFVNKLADISRQEDCLLSRSRACAAIELPSSR